ncbi:MAG TPA: class I SAM-dependent methyltransferase [Gammaproteobacteria bacterium]|nr:class I SAM-dependent methyltransferase [Gammaproteobacteria bacterium]
MGTLADHLACYGFKNFTSSAAYLQWAGRQLGERRAQAVDRLRRPLVKDEVKPDNVLRFYDYIADPTVAPVVHSMKTDAIRASGEAIWGRIRERKNILDLGCNIGYLSTWYAQQGDNVVTGVDVSQVSIDEAKRKAQSLGCKNVRFVAGDVRKMLHSECFDAIVDTQTIYTLHKKKQTLMHLRSLLYAEGILVTIPPIRTPAKLAAYVELLSQAGFHVRRVEFVVFSALGEPDIHPVIEAGKLAGAAQDITVDQALAAMQQALLQHKMPV